jgi:hypothetical protein
MSGIVSTLVISALGRLRKKDIKFEASLDYIYRVQGQFGPETLSQKKKKIFL